MRTNILQAKKALLALFAMLMPLLANADPVEIDGIWYNLVSKAKQAEVTSNPDGSTKYSGPITIPATVTYEGVDYSVTSIGEKAFYSCTGLTSVAIPESVTTIGEWAFYAYAGSSRLTKVYISSLEAWCNIDLGNSSSNPLSHAHNLYLNGELMTELVIPESVTSIGDYAFYGCSSLTSITLPEGVISIGYYAFRDCSSLASIYIPESITSIGEWAFFGTNLTSVSIPEGVTSINSGTFGNCSSLTAITLPEGVTSIGNSAFSGCSSLTSIIIPEDVTYIGERAFEGCKNLTSVIILEGVTSIRWAAFRDCSSLTSVTIPGSLTMIEGDAFYGCKNLTDVYISSIEAWCNIYFKESDSDPFLYASNLYLNGESITRLVIPDGVTYIRSGAFRKCGSLTTIVLPPSVSCIGSEAFANCPELTDVYSYAETAPDTETETFSGSYIEYATLHVPESAVASYKTTTPWSSFGTIVALGAAITRITLDYTAATLTEGEELKLTTTTTPDNADKNLISWSSSNPCIASVDNTGKVTAIASGTATITAKANDGSGVSAQCEVTVKELILGKCATPSINYVDGKVSLTCETEGAKVITTVANGDDETFEVLDFDLIPTYTITAYATKSKYENSDEVTLTICWVPCTDEHEGEDTGILTIPAKPVLIQSQGGTITLNGISDDTEVVAYDLAGNTLGEATATGGTATLTTNLTKGDIVIVKIGNNSIKIAIK